MNLQAHKQINLIDFKWKKIKNTTKIIINSNQLNRISKKSKFLQK